MLKAQRDRAVPKEPKGFAELAEQKAPGLVREFWDFLRHHKKWWLLPIIIVLMLAAALILLGGSAFAPFIYPLF